MKKVLAILLIWRSVPAILVYLSLTAEIKGKIDKDIGALGVDFSILALHELLLFNYVFRRQFMVRVYRMIRWTYKPLESLEISAETNQIGGGLHIYHGYSTIIYCHSMGENCSVYQNVTIGRGKEINGVDVPIIGNNVTIYAGAIVIGGVHIGNNVKIGAGAVVVKDVPDNATVVGAKARVLEQ